ncbi:MAG: urease accessory protein UreD [Aquabacterium sp.]|uniref:urease accessory protein UreD n=1 Tax=Aquabacterium sp. TaxID=1872578 RepID=UPI001DEB947B|nr:urease accessory protein UreD [Aquabacterium sp.]MBT9610416.1 urease accessory protein UreD [Aquabacterium sp.]
MTWHGQLHLNYTHDGERTIALDRHHGPLRVLQRLYPEGPGVCHHVLVHPPGGIAGGDALDVQVQMAQGCHALITTPGATRFYKSQGDEAVQSLHAHLSPGTRLEWLPLETLAYRGCRAVNRMRFDLAPGAEMMGWDVLALGLPAAREHFDDPAFAHGRFTQEIHLPGNWLERGTVAAHDATLLDSPLGWDGRRVMATLWWASGAPTSLARREALLQDTRELQADSPLASHSGSTSPNAQVVVLRVLAERVEPAMALLTAVWARWRQTAWGMAPCPPRVWRT